MRLRTTEKESDVAGSTAGCNTKLALDCCSTVRYSSMCRVD